LIDDHMQLYRNQLTGSIPTELALLTDAAAFVVDYNQLTGSIPTELALLTDAAFFIVHDNPGLCGDLVSVGAYGTAYLNGIGNTLLGTACSSGPGRSRLADHFEYLACLASPTTCTALELNNQGLVGTIPTEMGDLTALKRLILYGNALTGTIPTELGRLTLIDDHMRLNRNQLTGSIPAELALLTDAAAFVVHDNPGLCGPLVSVGVRGTTYFSGIGNTGLGTNCQPCCQDLRLNLVFCCFESRHPELARNVCRECRTGQ
jgi:hypothetical protein